MTFKRLLLAGLAIAMFSSPTASLSAEDQKCDKGSYWPGWPNFISFQEYAGRDNVTCKWWGETGSNGVFSADTDSVIKIHFDKNALEKIDTPTMDDFLNSQLFFSIRKLSLAARIGERQIEVQGFSEVGKDRTPVGLTGMSPSHFMTELQYLQFSLIKLIGDYEEGYMYDPDGSRKEKKMEMAIVVNDILKRFSDENASEDATAEAFFKIMRVSPIAVANVSSRLNEAVTDYKERRSKAEEDDNNARLSPEYKKLAEELDKLYIRYNELDRLNTALTDDIAAAEKSAPDKVAILRNDMDKNKAELAYIMDKSEKIDKTAKDMVTNKNKLQIQTFPSLMSIISDTNSIINNDFIYWAKAREQKTSEGHKEDQAKDARKKYRLSENSKRYYNSDEELQNDVKRYWEDEDDRKISRKSDALHQLYANLVDGQIVLSNVGAKPGDVVKVDILAYPGKSKSGEEKPAAFTIAQIFVDDFGWKTSVLDSFMLVKKANNKGKNLSESNFKGAAGVSLLWSYNARPGESFQWLKNNVSAGVNVSYLDFDNTKDIEVGSGLVLGLFRNMLHAGAGVNLNSSGNFSDRMYYFLGFSFANLAEKIGEKNVTPPSPN